MLTSDSLSLSCCHIQSLSHGLKCQAIQKKNGYAISIPFCFDNSNVSYQHFLGFTNPTLIFHKNQKYCQRFKVSRFIKDKCSLNSLQIQLNEKYQQQFLHYSNIKMRRALFINVRSNFRRGFIYSKSLRDLFA